MKALELNSRVPYAVDAELIFLNSLRVSNIVMLGAGPGVMAMAVLEGNPDAVLLAVDHETVGYTMAHLIDAGFDQNVMGTVCDSAQAAEMFTDGVVDLLIVDADHSYEGVKKDILAWRSKVSGFIFFHDYDANGTDFEKKERYPGVKQAVDEFFDSGFRVGTAYVVRCNDKRTLQSLNSQQQTTADSSDN